MGPIFDLAHGGRIEAVHALLGAPFHNDQSGLAQCLQVLRDGRGADVELVGNVRGGNLVAPGQHFQNGPAGRVGQGGEAIHGGYYKVYA